MALSLQQILLGLTGSEVPIYGYRDEFGQTWRQAGGWNNGQFVSNGGWERQTGTENDWQGLATPTWSADDPNASRWTTGFDTNPFQQYLQYVQNSGDVSLAGTNQELGSSGYESYVPNQGWLSNPVGLFDLGFNRGNRRSLNPYYNTQIRDVMREVAGKLGLKASDSDRAALEYAQQHYGEQGHGYTEASHPAIVANAIASRLFGQAGKTYQGLTPEEFSNYVQEGALRQHYFKEADGEAWKKDDVAGIAGVWTEQIQSAWESSTNDGLPSEQALAGADNPWNTWLQNQLRNEDWDPHGNVVALPTEKNYEQAQAQGYETGASQLINKTLQQAMMWYLGSSGITGDLTSGATSGIDPTYVEYGKDAKTAYDYYKEYEKYRAGGEFNPGALFNVATYASSKSVGDFNSNNFSDGDGAYKTNDSPFDSNSFYDQERFGSGGNVYDENGNWMEGEYDQYGNFVPSDQTTFGDNYGQGEYDGQGNDIFGGGNLEETNPELFGNSGSFNLSGLGSLFSGLGSGLSGLLGGAGTTGNGTNSLLALAPILAAIQYARQQGPFDTSRLTGLADRYNPDAMAYQYDRNTELQRGQLNSSLADRGVMGSSFGNMDITNFNTNRELGRGALISQASLGGADIAQKILQAQIEERKQKNQMYGSALYSLGNVFGGKR